MTFRSTFESRPTVILVIGLAGCGKTTLLHRLSLSGRVLKTRLFLINLDPAAGYMPYCCNIDIRDTVNYKNIMNTYGLGPHGGIMTALNLFATKFDHVISMCQKQCDLHTSFIIADTPGQIEIFSWSAAGSIMTEALASSFPTQLAFVVDTIRCHNPQTFVCNMLQACSILYKTRLPLYLIFNKCETSGYLFVTEWISDFKKFQKALDEEESYFASLSCSMSLALEEFYRNLDHIGLSALTGLNIESFFSIATVARHEYFTYYLPGLEVRRQDRHGV
jgi:GTPase SAR1 family protein